MLKMHLQHFAETVQGKKIVYLFRLHEERTTVAGGQLAFATENETSISKDADTTQTKDGSVRTPSEAEIEITGEYIAKKGDPVIRKYRKAMLEDKLFDIWEVDLSDPIDNKDNKYYGTYYQGYMTEHTKTSSAEDACTISITFGVNGKGADGEVTVTDTQQEEASYVFEDSVTASA